MPWQGCSGLISMEILWDYSDAIGCKYSDAIGCNYSDAITVLTGIVMVF